MQGVEKLAAGWRLSGGGLALAIDSRTGSLSRLSMIGGKEFLWTARPGDVVVRDDRIRREFGARDMEEVKFGRQGGVLTIEKSYRGAPWQLRETYSAEEDVIRWDAAVSLDSGEYRSCCVSYHIPWPQPLYPVSFWTAREKMPSAPHRFAGISLEYGEITSGTLIPALCSYLKDKDAGLLLAMPFDFRTPRFSFASGYRDPALRASFDWMALAPGRPARASLMMRATGGDWRPALGWLYQRYREYFEPRSRRIHDLWGGHVSGRCDVTPEQAKAMVELGLAWHEIHMHFPAYGNYHPEGVPRWRSGHFREDETLISVEMVRQTIRNLHDAGAAALPYIQVTGDGDAKLLPASFAGSRVRDIHGDCIYFDQYDVFQMNTDLSLPFGRDITRQIKGMAERYPEMDGVFLDQPCYNWLDTAHDDGITAVNNRPCCMTGFNYFPHLEHLSSLLHPAKVIIGNAPFGIGIMKYVDGFMAEGSGWLCDHLQYYGLAKPMFFLVYETTDRDIELMFQRCLIYAAGFSSYPAAKASKELYDKYLPVLKRLFRRRWVFDPDPLRLPAGFQGGLFRSLSGALLASIVSIEPRLSGRALPDCSVCVRTADVGGVKKATLYQPGLRALELCFAREKDGIVFDIPGSTIAAVAELRF